VKGQTVRRSVLFLLLGLAWAADAAAQPAPLQGLDEYAERAMRDWEVPGLALAVVHGDSLLYARGYGTTRLDGEEAVDEHTLFAIASTTKAMTVAVLGTLVEEDRLGWDDPVTRHLPAFAVADPYVSRELKVQDLLTHRVGVARLDNIWIASPFDRAEILWRARHLPQVDGFRESYNYNNILYIAAGELAGAVAGSTWDDLVEERLFAPLGMERSTTRAAVVESRGNVAHSHTVVEGEVRPVPRRDYDAIGGAGAAWSSAWDMARWVRLHLGSGSIDGRRVLDSGVLEEMYVPHTPIPVDTVSKRLFPTNHFQAYGLGWRVQDLHGRKVVQHSGSINYTRTQVTMVPEEGIGVVAMANLSTSNLQLALTHWILDALQGRDPADWSGEYLELARRSRERSEEAEAELEEARLVDVAPSLDPEGYAGSYEDDLFGAIRIEVEGRDGRASAVRGETGLVLHYSPEYVADLEHWHQDVFRARWRRPGAGRTFVRFTLDTRGRITAAEVDGFATFTRVNDGS
jgi:CubicO group peptidase (beta-lactamase class C family)